MFSATLAIGAVHATTQVVLAALAVVLLSILVLGSRRDRGLSIPPFAWIPIAAFAWTALQLVPLPLALARVVSPHAAAVRDGVSGALVPLTLDAAATTLELAKLVAALCVLLVGTEILRHSARRVGTAFAAFGLLLVVILWAHRFTGASSIYGFYVPHAMPGSGLFPPFVNGNNMASVLALCALAAAGAALDRRDALGPVFGAIAFFCAVSTLGTGSRGGAVGLAVGALYFFVQVASVRFGRVRAVLLSLLVVAVLVAGTLFLATGLRSRFVSHSTGDTLTSNQKTRGWAAGFELANHYPLTGVGRGAFEAPVAAERINAEGIRLVYPENVILQVVSEWGWPIGLALLGWLVVAFVKALRSSRLEATIFGLAGGVIAVAVHELADFGLEFPGVALPTTLALAAVVACAESENHDRPRPRLRGAALVASIVLAAVVVVAGASACRHTLARDLQHKDDLAASIGRHPASAELEMAAAEQASAAHDPSVLHHLGRAMRLEPHGSLPHALAAVELERLHRYSQAALEYRLARENGAELDDAALVRHLGSYALDVEAKQVGAYLRLGAVYAAYHRYDDATQAYERAAEISSTPALRAEWLRWMPPERRPAVLETIERAANDGDELATAIAGWVALGNFERAERVFASATTRYPSSPAVAIAGARMRLAHNDLEGARKAIGFTSRFDDLGRLQAEEMLVEVAQRSGDLDQVAAARARIRFLRMKLHIEEPANGGTP